MTDHRCWIGVPHRVMADDVYRGYDIPDGALVIPNIWYVTPATHAFTGLLNILIQVDDTRSRRVLQSCLLRPRAVCPYVRR